MINFKYLKILTLIALFSLPVKLSWAYISLTPAIIWFLYLVSKKEIKIDKQILNVYFPLFLFYAVLIFSSFFGINTTEALVDSSKALLYSVSPLLFYYVLKETNLKNLEFSLALGFCIICLITLETYSNIFVFRNFSTSISLSGQLAIALTFFIIYKLEETKLRETSIKKILFGLSIFFSSIFLVLSQILIIKIISLAYILAGTILKLKNNQKTDFINLISIPLMLGLLLLNLKRGPIIGLIISTLCYSLFFKRRLSIIIVALSFTLFIFLPQLQERILASLEHFFIKGGRYEIWSIGFELIGRYPLGLGFSSSEFLQNFSLDIPINLKHFHNNFLNILIECGWIPLFILLWFFVRLANFSIKEISSANKNIISLAALFSIITMQIAGIFEYNFGDSEVLLVAYFFIGVIFYSSETKA